MQYSSIWLQIHDALAQVYLDEPQSASALICSAADTCIYHLPGGNREADVYITKPALDI
jgi:hypothetical protein